VAASPAALASTRQPLVRPGTETGRTGRGRWPGLRCLRGLERIRRRDRCVVGYLLPPTVGPCPGRGACPDTPRGNPPGPLHRL